MVYLLIFGNYQHRQIDSINNIFFRAIAQHESFEQRLISDQ